MNPLVLIVIGVLCVIAAVWLLVTANTDAAPEMEVMLMSEDQSSLSSATLLPALPEHWDERTITHTLERYRNQPEVFTHYVQGIRGRFIDGQNIKTLTRRTEFLQAKITALQVGKEYLTLIAELRRLQTIEHTKDVQAHTTLAEAQHEQQSREQLRALELRLKQSELELKIAEIERKKRDVLAPPAQPTQSPPRDERAEKRAYWKGEVDRLQKEKHLTVAQAADEEHRVRLENIYEDKISAAMEQWSKYL